MNWADFCIGAGCSMFALLILLFVCGQVNCFLDNKIYDRTRWIADRLVTLELKKKK